MKSKQEPVAPDIVNKAITEVKKRHYLGASNHKTNPTGGLNGYYRNIATGLYEKYRSGKMNVVSPDMFIYLNWACIVHTGAGNCGELTSALYLELFCADLSAEQRKQVLFRSYKTNDEHGHNAYLQIGKTVYDIWADKQYNSSKLRANTRVAEKKHSTDTGIDASRDPKLNVMMKRMILEKFAKQFDEKILEERVTNQIYPTLDNTDPSGYALWASDAFTYLYGKFVETFEDAWYVEHQEVADSIRKKIIRDYLFLIEELRQDIPLHPYVARLHPARIKYSAEEVIDAVTTLVPNTFFVECLMAYSYINTNPQQSFTLLSGFLQRRRGNTHGPLEAWLVNTVLTECPMLMAGEADFAAALLPMLSAVKQGMFDLEVALRIMSWLLPEMKRQETGPRAKQTITRAIQSEDNRLLKDAYVRHGGSSLFFADLPSEKVLEKMEQEVKENAEQAASETLKHFCLM